MENLEEYGINLKCSQCGNIPSTPSRHCGKCGGSIKIKCGQCGHLSEWGRHYCEKCGNPLPRISELPEKPSSPFSSKAKSVAQPGTPDKPAAPSRPVFSLKLQSLQEAVDEIGDSFRKKLQDLSSRKKKEQGSLKRNTQENKETPGKTIADKKNSQNPPNISFTGPDDRKKKDSGRKKQFPSEDRAEKKKKTDVPENTDRNNASTENSDSARISVRDSSRISDPSEKSSVKKISFYALLIGIVAALAGTLYYVLVRPYLPKLQLTIAAKDYLTAFTQGRYEDAYKMLSTNSKLICPLEDYLYYNKNNFSGSREFRNIEVHSIAPTHALVKYQIRDDKGEWTDDYTSFLREQDKWTRPYAWTLYQPIQDSLNRRDYIQALYLAQKLYMTDPANPVSSAYLCMAEYHSGLYDKSAESCDSTLQSIEDYPVKMNAEELNWVMVYLGGSLVQQNRKRSAFDVFDRLEEKNNLLPEQQCAYRYDRAELFLKNSDSEKAKADLRISSGICREKDPVRQKVSFLLKQLDGKASSEAIAFAQRSKIREDLPTVEDLRRQIIKSEARKRGSGRYAPSDVWKAEYKGNANYRVRLESTYLNSATGKPETNEIFIVIVNLWKNTGTIEKPMELPEEFR